MIIFSPFRWADKRDWIKTVFLNWIGGFVYILEGLISILTLGIVKVCWSTQYNCWQCDLDF